MSEKQAKKYENSRDEMIEYYRKTAIEYANKIIPNMDEKDRETLAMTALVKVVDKVMSGVKIQNVYSYLRRQIEGEYRGEDGITYTKLEVRIMRILDNIKDRLLMEKEREPNEDEIAQAISEELGISEEKIRIALEKIAQKKNIESTVRMSVAIPDSEAITQEEIAERHFIINNLAKALNNLSEKEREVLVLLFGIDNGGAGRTAKEVAEMFDCSESFIGQIKQKALAKLRYRCRTIQGYAGTNVFRKAYHGENLIDLLQRKDYDENGYDEKGFNINGFDRKGVHKETGTKYDLYGFDESGARRSGFNKKGIHEETGTKYDPDGYDIRGFNNEGIHKETGTEYDSYGYDENVIHKETGTKYNPQGYTRNGYDVNGQYNCKYNIEVQRFDRNLQRLNDLNEKIKQAIQENMNITRLVEEANKISKEMQKFEETRGE